MKRKDKRWCRMPSMSVHTACTSLIRGPLTPPSDVERQSRRLLGKSTYSLFRDGRQFGRVGNGSRERGRHALDLYVDICDLRFIARNQLEVESATNQMRMTGDLGTDIGLLHEEQ